MTTWQPSASLAQLRQRGAWLAAIRGFFATRGVLEVETPILSAAANTDPALESFSSMYHGPGGGRLYLQTSPEFPMKRLLAAGSGDIYQIARVFRDGEAGRYHNPEFSLLEWYRLDLDHHGLMDEVAALVRSLIPDRGAIEKHSYRQVFAEYLDIENVHHTGVAQLIQTAQAQGIEPPPGLSHDDLDGWRDLLLSHCVIPHLGQQGTISFLHDYPASQAALAKLRQDEAGLVAERFELFLDGIELANGFHELTDAQEQAQRFATDNQHRRAQGQVALPVDNNLIAALQAGLPPCAGVALGLDRLLMVANAATHLDEVLSFAIDRA